MVDKLAESGFNDRLAYARWVFELSHPKDETDGAFAKNAGVDDAWYSKWKGSAKAPTTYENVDRVARYLGVESRWLLKSEGSPPRPDLWTEWFANRPRTQDATRKQPEEENFTKRRASPKSHTQARKRRR